MCSRAAGCCGPGRVLICSEVIKLKTYLHENFILIKVRDYRFVACVLSFEDFVQFEFFICLNYYLVSTFLILISDIFLSYILNPTP